MQQESPGFHRPDCSSPICLNLSMYDRFINATATYRLDSSYVMAYGNAVGVSRYVKQVDGIKDTDPLDIQKRHSKPRGAVVIISNCRSARRNFLIKRLSQLVRWANGTQALEVYGKCAETWSSEIINETPNTILQTFQRPSDSDEYLKQSQKRTA